MAAGCLHLHRQTSRDPQSHALYPVAAMIAFLSSWGTAHDPLFILDNNPFLSHNLVGFLCISLPEVNIIHTQYAHRCGASATLLVGTSDSMDQGVNHSKNPIDFLDFFITDMIFYWFFTDLFFIFYFLLIFSIDFFFDFSAKVYVIFWMIYPSLWTASFVGDQRLLQIDTYRMGQYRVEKILGNELPALGTVGMTDGACTGNRLRCCP